jgi:hypothetical protein
MMTAKLLEIDRPTSRGVIYPRAVVESALKRYFEKVKAEQMLIFKDPAVSHTKDDIVGVAENFRFEGDYLVADVGFLQEKMADVGQEGEVITIRPNGLGNINQETHIVENYNVTGLVIRHKS